MAKATKTPKPRAKEYEEPLKVNGSFMDVIGAAVKQSKDKTAAKKATTGSTQVTDQGGLTAAKKAG